MITVNFWELKLNTIGYWYYKGKSLHWSALVTGLCLFISNGPWGQSI